MRSALRSIGVVLLGALVTSVLIFAVQGVIVFVFPPPTGTDWKDPEQLKAIMAKAPLGVFVLLLAGYAIGTFAGSWMAARLAGRAHLVHALIVGALFLAGGIVNLKQIPHPLWFAIVNLLEFPVMAFLGGKLAERRLEKPSAQRAV